LKISHIFPYLICGGREYSSLQPVSLLHLGASCDLIEIWLIERIGTISTWEDKITLNNKSHTIYRGEYRPEIIRASDCRFGLSRHLDRNSDLFETSTAERINWFYTYIEE
jgi:hypothetical protein